MRKNKLFKDVALNLYLQGLKPKEIAAKLSVKDETVYRWKRQDKWDKFYEESQVRHTINYLYRIMQEETVRNPSDVDAINKHTAVIIIALTNPHNLMERRIANALEAVEKALKEHLI